ncbi:MAG: type I restriction enzyme HsdR N-terminal domain-containing protein [Alloprevotella sp.]|nr:type I restriction enzyme HsdR N-terminal domain-containing protein [Alloprevotella sp.]
MKEQLNLPPIEARIRRHAEGYDEIFDPLRKRFVRLTPEEWVRQHFVSHLVNSLHYPAPLLQNEVKLTINGVERRCDTVLFSRQGGRPRLIVEYKAPEVALTQRVFQQINSYNSVLRADYLMVSNGREHYCLHLDYAHSRAEFLPALPAFEELA